MLHKFRKAMNLSDNRYALARIVVMDDFFIGTPIGFK